MIRYCVTAHHVTLGQSYARTDLDPQDVMTLWRSLRRSGFTGVRIHRLPIIHIIQGETE